MRGRNFYYATLIVGITAVLTVGITLKLSRSRRATPVQPASSAPLVARAATPADEYRGAQKEGIKVHGHWTIDVRNPDGTLVTHSEFENALTLNGAFILSNILGRTSTPGLWRILLQSGGSSGSPWSDNSNGVIAEPNDPAIQTAPSISKNLLICVGNPGSSGDPCADGQPSPPRGTFLLRGSIPVQRNGTISNVGTFNVCLSCIASGLFSSGFDFTDHPLAQLVNGSCPQNMSCEVNVVPTQIIVVTVVISFS